MNEKLMTGMLKLSINKQINNKKKKKKKKKKTLQIMQICQIDCSNAIKSKKVFADSHDFSLQSKTALTSNSMFDL